LLQRPNLSLLRDLLIGRKVGVSAPQNAMESDKAPSAARWSRLFEKLGCEATDLQHLSVYWDHEGYLHRGLGKDISFVQALLQLKVTKTIPIRGFYAQRWPEYLEEKMGLKPSSDQNIPGSTWSRMLKNYQKGTEGIRP
jgi:hypothetical protein